MQNRREFIKLSLTGMAMAGSTHFAGILRAGEKNDKLYKISLAEWSLHRKLFDGELDNLDFARVAQEHGIYGLEYVNQFFMDKAKDEKYLQKMNEVAADHNCKNLLIMCDREGHLGDPDDKKRTQAVENHYKWVDAASFLGCHSIRVNARSQGTYEEQQKLVADGLSRLVEYAAPQDINVLVENHGGLSSNAEWLVGVMDMVDHSRVGTLPDFGNFRISENESYDRYKGVKQLMPYAKAVSAKSGQFDKQGNETNINYFKMMDIVLAAGYRGYVGIEYGGGEMDEIEGIKATKALLERVRKEHAEKYKS